MAYFHPFYHQQSGTYYGMMPSREAYGVSFSLIYAFLGLD